MLSVDLERLGSPCATVTACLHRSCKAVLWHAPLPSPAADAEVISSVPHLAEVHLVTLSTREWGAPVRKNPEAWSAELAALRSDVKITRE